MKRSLVISVLLAMLCAGCACPMRCPLKGGRPMMEKGGMWCCCPMHGEMFKTMMKPSVVAPQDGGIVVLMGNKIVKYDKDLNIQKEAEIKCDMERMRTMMKDMCADCPMCRKMWKRCGLGKEGWHKEHGMKECGKKSGSETTD